MISHKSLDTKTEDTNLRKFPERNFFFRFVRNCKKMTKVFIGNLSRQATDRDLRELFESFGSVEEVDSHAQKGFGFVVSFCYTL